jgi:predicted membrane protein
MNAFVSTIGFIALVVLCTYVIYKVLVAIKLIVIGNVWKMFSKPTPEYAKNEHNKVNPPKGIKYRAYQIISFLKLVKNEKLVYNSKPFSYFKYTGSNSADDKPIQPVGKPVKPNLEDSGHGTAIVSNKRESA